MNSVAQRVVRWAARQGSLPAGLFHAGTLSKGETQMPHRLEKSLRVVGAKQTLKVIQAEQAEVVYLARDADEHVTGPIRRECLNRGINIVDVETMAELGRACSIQVGAAVASVMKSNEI